METNESEGNLLKGNHDAYSNNSQEVSTNNFNKTQEDSNCVNSSKCKKNNDFNGESENYLAVDNNNSDNSLKTKNAYRNNNKLSKDYNTDDLNSYTLKTAGLCSERCTRDFMSVKNKKYHWNPSKMTEIDNFNNNKRYNNEMNTNKLNGDNIFKSNCILRNENRIKNTSHSDIFGVNNENNFKRKAKSNSFNGNRSDDENNSSLSNRDYESCSSSNSKNGDKGKEEPEETEMENSRKKERETDKENNLMESGGNLKNVKEEEDSLPTNMVIKLSKLKSETNEKDLIKMCNNCDLKVLSVNLDRNIINHNCTGTGRIVVKARKGDLVNFQNLLNSQGFKYII